MNTKKTYNPVNWKGVAVGDEMMVSSEGRAPLAMSVPPRDSVSTAVSLLLHKFIAQHGKGPPTHIHISSAHIKRLRREGYDLGLSSSPTLPKYEEGDTLLGMEVVRIPDAKPPGQNALKPPHERASVKIEFRLTPEQSTQLDARVSAAGVSRSQYIRDRLGLS